MDATRGMAAAILFEVAVERLVAVHGAELVASLLRNRLDHA